MIAEDSSTEAKQTVNGKMLKIGDQGTDKCNPPCRLVIRLLFLLNLAWPVGLWAQEQPEYGRVEAETLGGYAHPMPDEGEPYLRQELGVSESVQPLLAQAKAVYSAGHWTEAIAILEGVLAHSPEVMPAWDLLGDSYWMAGRPGDALKLWNRLIRIRPDFAPAYGWLGRAYLMQGDVVAARAAFRKGVELDGLQGVERLNYARVLRWSGDHEAAADLLRPMAQANPGRLDVALELASALLSNRDYEEALPWWQMLQKAEPTNQLIRARGAVALLHTGHVAEALSQAQAVLEANAAELNALGIMADCAQFNGGRPEEALSWLQKMIAAAGHPVRQRQLTLRYVNLYLRLHEKQPEYFPLDGPRAMLRELITREPDDSDLRLALTEALLLDGHFANAREQAQWVLHNLNPNNYRAQRNLFEIALAEEQYAEARGYLDRMIAFNPQNPYRHYFLARWYAAQDNYRKAQAEVDRLDAAGLRGAVAVLLYHGLSSSENGVVVPAKLFREHLLALRNAGFRFVTASKLAGTLAEYAKEPQRFAGGSLDRAVCVTFDDARRDSLRYGTPVGRELGLVFAMHIPVGYVTMQHPFICTWNQLRDYQRTKCWVFGGHSFDAHDRAVVDAEQRLGFALPNHLWLPGANRLETDEEYAQRLEREYEGCREKIAAELGRGQLGSFFAYPFGDIGQLTRSNDPDAPHKNLEHCQRAYSTGFIQTAFGYAVAEDNPLLYQRVEPDRLDSGLALVQRLLENHPVNVARRLRAEFAAAQGKRHLVIDTLCSLARDGYPMADLRKLRQNLEHRLGRTLDIPELDVEPLPTKPAAP